MMFRTHILFALFFYLLFCKIFSFNLSITFGLVLCLGAILPDIDSPSSFINKHYLLGIGKTIAGFSEHRGFFHSLFGILIFFILSFIITYFFKLSMIYSAALSVGYFLHLAADSFTVSGIKWFWKASSFKTKGPIKTSSLGENLFFIVLILGIVYFIIGNQIQNITAFISKIKP